MSTKGGSSCAIANCNCYSGRIKKDGRTDVSFHRFLKDPVLQNLWVQKCKRGDIWNPNTSYVCSEHFNSDDFLRDLKAELLGEKSVRRLKPNVVPTVNLPNCLSTETSTAIGRRSRMETKMYKAKDFLSELFTKNQLDLIMKKKVHWTRDESAKSFTLRCFSKRAYVYVKTELHYPLP
ncbi:THAP domain-containing protein 4-like, partial [Aphis craccivora]